MASSYELRESLLEIVNKYDEFSREKLTYDTTDKDDKKIKKYCTLEAAYAYKITNIDGDSILNLILVYDGWCELLQRIAMNGIYRGNEDNIGFDLCVYTLNINDFDMNEDSMLLYKDTLRILDKRGLFDSFDIEDKKLIKTKEKNGII